MNNVPRRTLFGIFFISLSNIMLELVLTRIFSVTMWYHFAFVAISLALLGSGASGVFIYLLGHRFPPEKTMQRLAWLALAFSVSVLVSFVVHLGIPFIPRVSLAGLTSIALIYIVIGVPFFYRRSMSFISC